MQSSVSQKVRLKGSLRYIYKKAGRAINEYEMISPRDKVLICLSGGLSSLVLTQLLFLRKRHLPVNFELIACTVNINRKYKDEQLVQLKEYLSSLNIGYIVRELGLDFSLQGADSFWCYPQARTLIYKIAQETGAQKIALGDSLDKICATILISLFFKGRFYFLKPRIDLKAGFSIIRPLIYLEEKELLTFSSQFSLPVLDEDFFLQENPYKEEVERIIASLNKSIPHLKLHLLRALEHKRVRLQYLL